MSKNNGGPAYPVIPPVDGHGHSPGGYPFPDSGMTLRDYFAGQALVAIIASQGNTVTEDWADGMYDPDSPADMERMRLDDEARQKSEYSTSPAKLAYEYADAMIAERDKP